MMPTRRDSSNYPTTRKNMFPDFFSNLGSFFDEDVFGSRMMPSRMMQNMPATNIKENDKNFQIEIAAPGLKKEDFNVDIENGMLTISAEKKDEKEEKDENYTRQEYNYSSFSRSFRLPESVTEDDIDASYKDGVLMLTIPKKEEPQKPQRKQINIK
jgi:HSP20 family protein